VIAPRLRSIWDACLFKQYSGGRGGYDLNHNYRYPQTYYTNTKQSQIHQGSGYVGYHDADYFRCQTPTPPVQPRAITVVLDTNVLLDYLMVIQKFVGDVERMKWPSVVVIPSVVISELDWCADPSACVEQLSAD
jgi:hypothetical protein